VRDELLAHQDLYIDQLQERIGQLAAKLRGVNYEVADVLAHCERHRDNERAVLYVNPPAFAKGYTKMFDAGGLITWTEPKIPEFDAKTCWSKLYALSGGAPALVYLFRGPQIERGEGREELAVFALERPKSKVDYLLCNRPDEARLLVKHRSITKIAPAKIPNLPLDHEMTDKSVAQIVPTTKERALYYRDLFAHKLGATRAEQYFLVLIDGYLMGVYGTHFSEVQRGQSGRVYETFGFNVPSQRHPRLNGLLMRVIMSEDARQFYQQMTPGALRDIEYFQTTCIASGPEVKANRGIVKLVSRESATTGVTISSTARRFIPEPMRRRCRSGCA
jgi:hypothetical protein